MQTGSTHICLIIPAFNEGLRLRRTLADGIAKLAGFRYTFVVVDDGSLTPIDPKILDLPADIHLLRHLGNLGQGAALQTGFDYACEKLHPDLIVTLDADGQHDLADLPRMIQKVQDENLDIVFGNRFAAESGTIPFGRKLLLKAANLFEHVLTGTRFSDAHNGYRVLTRATAERIRLKQNRMAHATEFKQWVRKLSLSYAEVPVTIRYTTETLQKGQRSSGSFKILKDLIQNYFFLD